MIKNFKLKKIFASALALTIIVSSLFSLPAYAYRAAIPGTNPTTPSNSSGNSASSSGNSAFSGSKDAVCNGVGLGGNACSSGSNGSSSINSIISNVLDILSWIVGVAAVFVLIISGIRMIASGGDSNSFNSAKNGILYAIIGLVIVATAQIIVQYVLKNATS